MALRVVDQAGDLRARIAMLKERQEHRRFHLEGMVELMERRDLEIANLESQLKQLEDD